MNVFKLYPELLEGFFTVYFSLEDAKLEHLPEYSQSAYKKITDFILQITEKKIFKMPDLTFYEMESAGIKWITQQTKALTQNNILSYAVSNNNKHLFKLIIENIPQSEVAKSTAFSQLIKLIDKLSEDELNYYAEFTAIESKLLLPISINAYATNNLSGIKFLEEKKLCKIINNIQDESLDINIDIPRIRNESYYLPDIIPILLETPNSHLIEKYKEYFNNCEDSVVKFNRLDIAQRIMESEPITSQDLLVKYSIEDYLENDNKIVDFLLEKYPSSFNIRAKLNKVKINDVEKASNLLAKFNTLREEKKISNILYRGYYQFIMDCAKEEDRSVKPMTENMKYLIKTTTSNPEEMIDIIASTTKNYDISPIFDCFNSINPSSIFHNFILCDNINNAIQLMQKHKISDDDIIKAIAFYADCNYKIPEETAIKIDKILEDVKDNDKIISILSHAKDVDFAVRIVKRYLKNINKNIDLIFNILTKILETSSDDEFISYENAKHIVYLSSLV
jgi:hypothetical protein